MNLRSATPVTRWSRDGYTTTPFEVHHTPHDRRATPHASLPGLVDRHEYPPCAPL